ncbi:MAG: DUF4349 domain-containing protein [Lachnospiraceae bacterium]|nr:DUF4349 domain-containing protein [Lachnospiraceae bacterium]
MLSICMAVGMLLFAGCGGSSSYNSSAKYAGEATTTADFASDSLYTTYDEEYAEEDRSSESVNENGASSNRKLITTVNLSAETTDFDTLINNINQKVAALGGYIESSNVNIGSSYYEGYGSSRSASMTIRVPANNLQEMTDMVTENSNITSQSKNVDDVTLSYVDLQSRKNAYKAEEERLLEMMEMTQTIDEMIIIEDKLADVRYHLESMESQLRTFDNQVDYSTVYLNIKEVVRITPPAPQSIGEKISEGFTENLVLVGTGIRDFFVGLIINLPFIVIWVIIILIVVFIVKAVSNHSKKKAIAKMRANGMDPYYGKAQTTGAIQGMQPGVNAGNPGAAANVQNPEEQKKDQ